MALKSFPIGPFSITVTGPRRSGVTTFTKFLADLLARHGVNVCLEYKSSECSGRMTSYLKSATSLPDESFQGVSVTVSEPSSVNDPIGVYKVQYDPRQISRESVKSVSFSKL